MHWMKRGKGKECECGWFSMKMMKLSLVAGVLFLLQVWPALMNLVHSVHWGWFLGAAVLFCLLGMKHMWICGKKKKK